MRVLLEIATEEGTLPAGRQLMHRRVTLVAGDRPPVVEVTIGTTVVFPDLAAAEYNCTLQDVADDESLLGPPKTGPLLVGTAPPPGGTYAASAGFTYQVLA